MEKRPKKKTTPKRGRRGPPSDDAIKAAGALPPEWRDDAAATMLVLQGEIRKRAIAGTMDTFELIGAYRALGETLTTNQALIGDPADPSGEDAQ